jgi:general secretion pathway protein B
MSYILDALKRADAERERGQVPGLHAQPIDNLAASERGPGVPRWALYAGGGTALVIVAALAWRMGADAHAPLPTPMMAAPEPAPAAVAVPAPAVVATAPLVEPPVTASPAETASPAPAPAPPPVAHVAPPRPAPRLAPEAKPATRPAPAAAPAPAPAPAVARVKETTIAPAVSVPLLADLPGSLRQQVPAMTVTGSVYSDDASSRFIMVNGEVVKEGGQPAPGVVLERIEPKSAVLRFKGERFRLPF